LIKGWGEEMERILSFSESLMNAGFCMLVVFALLIGLWAALSLISLALRKLGGTENTR
jgi:hypothetical protein